VVTIALTPGRSHGVMSVEPDTEESGNETDDEISEEEVDRLIQENEELDEVEYNMIYGDQEN